MALLVAIQHPTQPALTDALRIPSFTSSPRTELHSVPKIRENIPLEAYEAARAPPLRPAHRGSPSQYQAMFNLSVAITLLAMGVATAAAEDACAVLGKPSNRSREPSTKASSTYSVV